MWVERLLHCWLRAWPLLLAALSGALLALWLSDWNGHEAQAHQAELQAQHDWRQQQVITLQQKLTKADTELVVALGRDEENRKMLATLTNQLASAQQELAFLHSLVNPDSDSKGLLVEGVELQPLAAARSYRFRLVVVQRGEHDKASQVEVQIALEGSDGLTATTLDLLELAGLEPSQRQLSLRYFQVLEGTAVLPPGFTPSRLVVTVERLAVRGLVAAQALRSFVWADLVGEADTPAAGEQNVGVGDVAVMDVGEQSIDAANPGAIVEQNSQE